MDLFGLFRICRTNIQYGAAQNIKIKNFTQILPQNNNYQLYTGANDIRPPAAYELSPNQICPEKKLILFLFLA
jgi:hypothetical protein